MKHTPVDSSSNIKAIGYDEESKTLEVVFKGGGHYSYENVPVEAHKELMAAKSIGNYLHSNIKKYKFKKVK